MFKILRVVNWFNGGGGIEQATFNFLESFNSDRYQVDILCVGKNKGKNFNLVEQLGAKVYHVKKTPNSYHYAKKIKKFLYNKDYDLIEVHLDHLSGSVLWGASLAGIKHRSVWMHNTQCAALPKFKDYPILRFLRKIYIEHQIKLIESHATQYCFVGNQVREKFRKLINFESRPNQIIHLGFITPKMRYSPIDKDNLYHKYGIPKNAFIIGHVGAFKPQKNHQFILKVSELLSKHFRQLGKQVSFLLLGDGPLKNNIKAQVEKLGLKSNFILPGNVSNVENFYSLMDVFFLPSFHEGLSGALVEAQACRAFPVVSNIPENIEALYDYYHSFCFSLSDPNEAVNNILRVVQIRNKHNILDEAEKFVTLKFGVDLHVRNMIDHYNSIFKLDN